MRETGRLGLISFFRVGIERVTCGAYYLLLDLTPFAASVCLSFLWIVELGVGLLSCTYVINVFCLYFVSDFFISNN